MVQTMLKAKEIERCAGQLAEIFLKKRTSTPEELDYISQLIIRSSRALDEICDELENLIAKQAEELL